jgi:hypothetical protein
MSTSILQYCRNKATSQKRWQAISILLLTCLLSLPVALSAHDHSDHSLNSADCQLCGQLNTTDAAVISNHSIATPETAAALYLPAQYKRITIERVTPVSRGPPQA